MPVHVPDLRPSGAISAHVRQRPVNVLVHVIFEVLRAFACFNVRTLHVKGLRSERRSPAAAPRSESVKHQVQTEPCIHADSESPNSSFQLLCS